MGLLAPLALLFLPLLAVVAAFYFLRMRRPEAAVSSLFLWDTLLRDRAANAPWQRLRSNLLLLLQLLCVAALILALARPWSASSQPGGRNLILVFDTSASMSARDGDGGTTRLDTAKQRALARAALLPVDGQATVIAAGFDAQVVLAASGDGTAIRKAITSIQPQPSTTDLDDALGLAAALAARQPDTEVDILSDGRFPDPRPATPAITGTVLFTKVGQSSENQGIVEMSLRRNVGTLSLFVQLSNSSGQAITRRLDVDLDGQAWAGRTLTLPSSDTLDVVLDDVPPAAQVVHARLVGNDDLALDDEAWTVNRLIDPSPALLVTDANRFLQNALALLPGVALEKTTSTDYAPSPTATLTIFDHVMITGTLPTAGNLLFIAPPRSTALFDVTGVLSTPAVLAPDAAGVPDPLLRFVDLSDLHIAAAQRLAVPDWGHVVLNSDGGPLLIAGESGGRKIAILTFDLHDSDLPIQMAFPLLMRNLVGYLLPEPAGGLPANVTPGDPVALAADNNPAITRITVDPPPGAGATAQFNVDATHRQFTYDGVQTLGLYIVSQWAGTQEVRREGFAANLFSADESRTRPRDYPPLPAGVRADSQDDTGRNELWPWLAAAALAFLLLEWLFTHQITFRRVGDRVRARRRAAVEVR